MAALCALFATFESPAVAQCFDPARPAGGYPLTADLDQLITFSDSGASTTRIDVRYPSVTPGPCGWPVVIITHGLGLDRQRDAGIAVFWAELGYLAAIYDVRGQGQHTGATRIVGGEARLDLVEVVGWIASNYSTQADMNRLGIAGFSQGGLQAWAAAAWSGKPIPGGHGRTVPATFPVFRAACASWFPPFTGDLAFPQGKAVHTRALSALAFPAAATGVRLESTFQMTLQGLVFSGMFNQASAFVDADPLRQDLAGLATSTVPVLAQVNWNDPWHDVSRVEAALDSMPATTPKRAFYSRSQGHSSPDNDRELALHLQLWERWMARFVKGENNDVENEATTLVGLRGIDEADDLDPTSTPWLRAVDAFDAPGAGSTQRYFLRDAGALAVNAPMGPETPDTVTHQVAAGFGLPQFLQQAFTRPSLTLPSIPLSSVAFDTPVLTDEVEVLGTPKVRLELDSNSVAHQVHCGLFSVNGNGDERMLTSGFGFVDAGTGAVALDVELAPVGARVLVGERVRLRVENLVYLRLPQTDEFRIAPSFASTQWQVQHSDTRPSWIDLPLRDVVQPTLSCDVTEVEVSSPAALRYELAAPDTLVGSNYGVLFSLSGTSASLALPVGDSLRLVCDEVTYAFVNLGAPIVVDTFGMLPASGAASPVLDLVTLAPLSNALRGVRLSAAGIVLAPSGPLATNTVDVLLR